MFVFGYVKEGVGEGELKLLMLPKEWKQSQYVTVGSLATTGAHPCVRDDQVADLFHGLFPISYAGHHATFGHFVRAACEEAFARGLEGEVLPEGDERFSFSSLPISTEHKSLAPIFEKLLSLALTDDSGTPAGGALGSSLGSIVEYLRAEAHQFGEEVAAEMRKVSSAA